MTEDPTEDRRPTAGRASEAPKEVADDVLGHVLLQPLALPLALRVWTTAENHAVRIYEGGNNDFIYYVWAR